jgi:hypothetical protein
MLKLQVVAAAMLLFCTVKVEGMGNLLPGDPDDSHFYEASNQCEGKKVELENIDCMLQPEDFALGTKEQSGVNITPGYQGDLEVSSVPITDPYYMVGMCPVNVHWHLGTEHYSEGEFDETGTGPDSDYRRRLAESEIRMGYRCHFYDESDYHFTTEYDWKYCVDMHVGETYEVHWPHSSLGDCGGVDQYQAPFYDGVFCNIADDLSNLGDAKIGVQGQIFTIINDESYYYPNLISGMIVDQGDMGTDVAKYTGSTTGTSRDNTMCSQYTGITWQVDRHCHLISASSFDKMCYDMLNMKDDMSGDLHAHGSRELVDDAFAANNQQRRLRHFERV